MHKLDGNYKPIELLKHMKGKVLFALLAAMSAAMPSVASEYKPLLEEGKSWTCQYRGSNNITDNPTLRGIGMPNFTEVFTANVAGDTIIDGKRHWRVVRRFGNKSYTNEYLLKEEDGVVSLPVEIPRGRIRYVPVMRCDVSVGDTVYVYDEYGNRICDYVNDDTSYYYKNIESCDTVVGCDGVERREISIGESSWVEGVGFSRGYTFMLKPMSGMACYGEMDFQTLDCSINGESIFNKKDFKLQFEEKVYDSMFTPGKSWTMARGNEIFTVSVVGDTFVGDGIPATRLIDSNGKEYLVIEDKGTVFSFFDRYGRPSPLYNAVPIIKCNLGVNSPYYRYVFGQEPDWDDEKDDLTNRYMCKVQSVNTLDVRGIERKEWVLEDAESGEVVASWVEGVGAPDAQSWATQMPDDYDLRMIDCRQDGEVIFTAEDFTHKSGIAEVTADRAERSGVYDLQGRRVSSPTRGLYIIDGKKTLLR